MQGNLLVTPEELESAADDFSTAMGQVTSITGEMMSQVTGLSSKWQGEASTAYINKFNQLEDDITKMKAMIQEHVNDLKDMATVYRQAESANQEAASALAGDVLN